MKCATATSLFSPYLDGAVTGKEMRALSQHLEACADCRYEYVSLHQTQQLLSKMGCRKPPADLALTDNPDVPLMLYTAPQLQQSAFGTALDSINEDSLVIEAYVDSNGRVQDYRILSNSGEAQSLLRQVKNMLIFTTFRPATSMGRPTAGRAVLSFSKISVKG